MGDVIQRFANPLADFFLRQIEHHRVGARISLGIADWLHGQVQHHFLALFKGDVGALLGEFLIGQHRHAEGNGLGAESRHQLRRGVAKVVHHQREFGQTRFRFLPSCHGLYGFNSPWWMLWLRNRSLLRLHFWRRRFLFSLATGLAQQQAKSQAHEQHERAQAQQDCR